MIENKTEKLTATHKAKQSFLFELVLCYGSWYCLQDGVSFCLRYYNLLS